MMHWKLCNDAKESGANSMILRQRPEDANAVRKFVPTEIKVEWVSPTDLLQTRRPKPDKRTVSLVGGFHAAGKFYATTALLCVSHDEDGFLGRDIFGREVMCFRERFPCFDSYDYLYEHRYYRWYLIKGENTLTLVYHADESKDVTITEDLNTIRVKWWEKMEEYGFCR